MPPLEIIAICGLVLNIIVAVVGLTWGLSKIKDAIRQEIEAHREKFDNEIDSTARSFGETVQALRNKVGEVELYVRDYYVRRDSFTEVIGRISLEIHALSERMDNRLERIENKIDNQH